MRRKAYAKITLSLQAVQRKNGTTYFDNVMVPIDLFDMIYLDKSEEMVLSTDKEYLPLDKRNTVIRVVEVMKEQYNINDNFTIRIVKNIPAQSGMGGGSADAAAIINMLNELYSLNMSYEDKIDVARKIDEDTPFCVFNQPARVSGIGDELTFIRLNTDLNYLIIKPPYGVSTKRFLKRFKSYEHDTDITEAMLVACETGSYEAIMECRHNALESTVMTHYPKLMKIIKVMEKLGLEGVCMTGTGTSIVGFSENIETVRKAYEKVALQYPFAKYGVIKGQDVIE